MNDKCTCVTIAGHVSCRLIAWEAELSKKESLKQDCTHEQKIVNSLVPLCRSRHEKELAGK